MSYQTISVAAEAIQWNGNNVQDVTAFLQPAGLRFFSVNSEDPNHLILSVTTTAGGIMNPEVTDWFVLQSDKWMLKTDAQFQAEYELAGTDPAP